MTWKASSIAERERLAGLVAGHEQPFPVLRPRRVELSLLRIRFVIAEPVLR